MHGQVEAEGKAVKIDKSKIILFIVAALAIASALYAWYRPQPVINKTEYVNVPQIKEVVRIKRIEVPVEKVVTIEKQVVVEKLKLPEAILKDEAKQIVATGEITPYEGVTNVVAVLDTKSGESEIIAKQKPLSLIAFENKKEIGVRYGVNATKGLQGDLYGRWDFLRVGSSHLGVYAEVNSRAEAKAMLSVGYRW